MKSKLLELLRCPSCRGSLKLKNDVDQQTHDEVETGTLVCETCHLNYPIRGGIPRFVNASTATAENFGAQWLEFDQVDESYHTRQFLDWIHPVTPDFFRDKVVLEAGCGKGRHTRLIASWGARAVVGVDFSDAVDAARRNTRDLENVHIIQADILNLPLKRSFEYAFSVGVLHHLPDPHAGFIALADRLVPGGAVSAWVYGRENNEWIVRVINPVRERFTSKLPFSALYYLSYVPSAMLYAVLKLVYAPLRGRAIGRRLFYGDYLGYISGFPFREIHNIVHDHLTAPIAYYISREEFTDWYREVNAKNVEISWHNRNSWRGFGIVSSNL